MIYLASQYENQARVFGKWGTTGLVGRHKYSDVTGKLKLKQEYFMPPRGWAWEEQWFIDPEKAWVFSLNQPKLFQLFKFWQTHTYTCTHNDTAGQSFISLNINSTSGYHVWMCASSVGLSQELCAVYIPLMPCEMIFMTWTEPVSWKWFPLTFLICLSFRTDAVLKLG